MVGFPLALHTAYMGEDSSILGTFPKCVGIFFRDYQPPSSPSKALFPVGGGVGIQEVLVDSHEYLTLYEILVGYWDVLLVLSKWIISPL